MSGADLAVEGLTLRYPGAPEPVFRDLSFTVPAGESLAIVGESGCGKSTLLAALAGFAAPESGTIDWGPEGRPHSSFVWQNLALFPWKRTHENLELALELSGVPKSERRTRVAAMLAELGLAGLEKRFPSELSGGQRQRLAIGRALIGNPSVLFMDEPFSALDALNRERLQDFLLGLMRRHPVRLVFVTHDIGEAVFLASRILVLGAHPGRKLALVENPAFTLDRPAQEEAGGAIGAAGKGTAALRERPVFFETARRVHALLAAGRTGFREDAS